MKTSEAVKVIDVDGVWSEVSKNEFDHIEGQLIPRTRYQLINPDMARDILDNNNTSNRKMAQNKINIYSSDLMDGKWAVTHQGIAFYIDGVLADGQHRLEAVVRTGVSALMLVVCGLSYESAIFIDEGKKRSVADVSDISPFHDTVTKDMQSIAAVVISSLRGKDKQSGAGLRVLNSTRSRLNFCEKHREALLEGCRLDKQKHYSSAVKVMQSVLFRLYYNLEEYNFTTERYDELIDTVNKCVIRKNPENNIERLWKKISEYSNRTGYKFYGQCHRWTEKCFLNFMMYKNMNRMSEEKNEIFPIPEELAAAKYSNANQLS